ncbi:hypothetical protein CCAX7_001520 [Capsulimonas corticalis]|uniref:Uncharacterized protein n=1 Tax=Capsulimonas corticalis TaxID=2219043 RepID=A0A402CRR7_9BACT|nr:hypothetical protein CCAX7_001520 [Capsulimonas corticalis]
MDGGGGIAAPIKAVGAGLRGGGIAILPIIGFSGIFGAFGFTAGLGFGVGEWGFTGAAMSPMLATTAGGGDAFDALAAPAGRSAPVIDATARDAAQDSAATKRRRAMRTPTGQSRVIIVPSLR